MQWKTPKNTAKYHWTQHVTEKMHYYGLSEQKILGVIRNPQRIETGIVENTVAVMVPVGNISKKDKKPSKWTRSFSDDSNEDKWNQEIWVMYQVKNSESRSMNQESKSKKIEELKKALKNKENIRDSKFVNHNSANRKICIISAWRYPGVSSENNPIPEEILREIEEIALK